tara:strand:+ start:1383 stop:1979 length:597 start_codon:yes stop_codon:yes gene_type:complete
MAHSTCEPLIHVSKWYFSAEIDYPRSYDPETSIYTAMWKICWTCGGTCPKTAMGPARPCLRVYSDGTVPCELIEIPIDLTNLVPADILADFNKLATAPPVMRSEGGIILNKTSGNHHGGMSWSHKEFWKFKQRFIDDHILNYLYNNDGIKDAEDKFLKEMHDKGVCNCSNGTSGKLKMAKSIADKISGDAMKRALSDY